jgi:hypothetical protein
MKKIWDTERAKKEKKSTPDPSGSPSYLLSPLQIGHDFRRRGRKYATTPHRLGLSPRR